MVDQKSKPKFNWGEWVEKYRFYIGGGLLFLILAGVGFQLYRENYNKPNYEERIIKLEETVVQLQKEQETSNKIQTNSNNQVSNIQTEQGTVAGASATQTTSTKAQVTGKININTASVSQLDALPGIGPAYAGRIIDYRNANGGFKSVDEIKNVKGIGEKTFEKFREQITI